MSERRQKEQTDRPELCVCAGGGDLQAVAGGCVRLKRARKEVTSAGTNAIDTACS